MTNTYHHTGCRLLAGCAVLLLLLALLPGYRAAAQDNLALGRPVTVSRVAADNSEYVLSTVHLCWEGAYATSWRIDVSLDYQTFT